MCHQKFKKLEAPKIQSHLLAFYVRIILKVKISNHKNRFEATFEDSSDHFQRQDRHGTPWICWSRQLLEGPQELDGVD